MTIILFLFIGLMGVLLVAFFNFDALVKIEYRKYRDEWTSDGKPQGIFWRPRESTWFSSSLATHKLSLRWLYKTPQWINNDPEAIYRLKKLRAFVSTFIIGMIFWFIIVILQT